MPDNGLANLAGALLCAGHETLVLDYGTTENIAAMFPKDARALAKAAYMSAMGSIKAGEPFRGETLNSFALLDAKLQEVSRNRCQQIAEDIIEHVRNLRADFVGFKLWNGDGFTGTIEIAKRVKSRCTNVKVFAGGAHVDIFREKIFEATDVFDALAFGEGEETIVQLAEFVLGKRKLADVDNVIFKENGRPVVGPARRIEDLNTLPLPCYDESVYSALSGNKKIRIAVLDESRGCPFGCYFCIHPIKSGSKLRVKNARRVVEEMNRITAEVGTRAFRYAGSATPPPLAKEIGNLIVGKRMDVSYAAFGNAQYRGTDCFEKMGRSGCKALFFGIESGSENILARHMGKKVEPARISEAIEASKKAGIFTVGSIIFPSPFETDESERQTIELLCEARPDSVLVQFPLIYPGTEWAEHPAKFGFSFDRTEYVKAAMTYKAKPLMPIEFWDDLPFESSGRDFANIRAEAARLTLDLERKGILTSVSDELALMADLAGFRGREREFRDLTRDIFFCGDVERIEEIVARINTTAMKADSREGEAMARASTR